MTPDNTAPVDKRRLARNVLFAFVVTFILARTIVILIMTRRIHSLYLHMGSTHTHIHHLNYGIFLLSIVGAFLLFRQPEGKALRLTALAYGVGLALTFDEFGMWVHLGGPYWQRASFDAVIVIIALLGLYLAAPALKAFRRLNWAVAVLLVASSVGFSVILADSMRFATERLSPILQQIEAAAPE
ncbi:MAG: hypothetical protein ABSE73_03315 [Planctomycetota bacterium]